MEGEPDAGADVSGTGNGVYSEVSLKANYPPSHKLREREMIMQNLERIWETALCIFMMFQIALHLFFIIMRAP